MSDRRTLLSALYWNRNKMGLSLDISFAEFLKEVEEKAEAIKKDSALTDEEKKAAVEELFHINYLVATKVYPDEIKGLFKKFKVYEILNRFEKSISNRLEKGGLSFNVFYDLQVLQVIKSEHTYHQKLSPPEELLKSLFKIEPGFPEYFLFLGFACHPKNFELLQLALFLNL